MGDANQNAGALFDVIPPDLRTSEQRARWGNGRNSDTYKMRRDPSNLNEVKQYKNGIAIWRDNGTMTYVTPHDSDDQPVIDDNQKHLILECCVDQELLLQLFVIGSTIEAVLDTVGYFMSLEQPTAEGLHFPIETTFLLSAKDCNGFDIRGVPIQFLTRLFEAFPSRHVELIDMIMSAEQSVALATRSHPVRLSLCNCRLADGGNAFVNALESRQSTIGTLLFHSVSDIFSILNDETIKRLLQINKIDCLVSPVFSVYEDVLLPYSTQSSSLEYHITSPSLTTINNLPLNIVPKRFFACIVHNNGTFPTEAVLACIRQVAASCYFVELDFLFIFPSGESYLPECVVEEITRAALANSNLKSLALRLRATGGDGDWSTPYLETLLNGVKNHQELCTLTVFAQDADFGPDFSYLRQLLSHNRKLHVIGDGRKLYSDGLLVKELYSLNRFYRGSAALVSSERPLLVGTCLVQRASNDFQRSALLLANHTDALCDLVQYAELDQGRGDVLNGWWNAPRTIFNILLLLLSIYMDVLRELFQDAELDQGRGDT